MYYLSKWVFIGIHQTPKIFNATYTHNKTKQVRSWEELKANLSELVNAATQIDSSKTISKNT